jgi:hypothetical protein
MARQKKMQFWISEKEYEQLKQFAERENLSMGEILRDYIKSLPQPEKETMTAG